MTNHKDPFYAESRRNISNRFSEAQIRRAEEIDIIKLIENDTPLEKCSGMEFKGLCPFPGHMEKTPSFQVNAANGKFYCFGCSRGGRGPINYIMIRDSKEWKHAMQILVGDPDDCRIPVLNSAKISSRTIGKITAKTSIIDKEKKKNRASSVVPQILRNYRIELSEVCDDSPIRLDFQTKFDAYMFVEMMYGSIGDENAIWIGNVHNSAKQDDAPERKAQINQDHFKTVSRWLSEGIRFPRIAPGLFQISESGRRKNNVVQERFLVLEWDELFAGVDGHFRKPLSANEKAINLRNNLTLTFWLKQKLELLAIVDTGNKSAHSWFRRPSEDVYTDLVDFAPGLGIDEVFKNSAAPLRLPGFPNEKSGRMSKLLWLKGDVV